MPTIYIGSSGDVVVHIPASEFKPFVEVIRRGMSFEHGEPPSMHDFAEKLREMIATPTTPAGTQFV